MHKELVAIWPNVYYEEDALAKVSEKVGRKGYPAASSAFFSVFIAGDKFVFR